MIEVSMILTNWQNWFRERNVFTGGQPEVSEVNSSLFCFLTLTDDSGHVCIGVSRNEQSVGSMPGALVESVGYISSGEILMGSNGEVEAQAYKQGL